MVHGDRPTGRTARGGAPRSRATLALVLSLAILAGITAGFGGTALAAPGIGPARTGDGAGTAALPVPAELQDQVKAAEGALATALAEAREGDADGVLGALEDFFQALVAMEGLLRDMPRIQGGRGGPDDSGAPGGAGHPGGPRRGPAPGGPRGLVGSLIMRLSGGLAEVVQALPEDGRRAVAEALRARADELKDHPLVLAVLRAVRRALGGQKPGGRAPDPERLAEQLARLEQAVVHATERAEAMAARIAERRERLEAMEEGPWKTVAELRLRAAELEYQRMLLLIQKLQVEMEAIRAALEAIESGAAPPNAGPQPGETRTGGL